MTKFVFTILLTSFAFISIGQVNSEKDKERINAVCDKFMKYFLDGKIPEAIQLLKVNSIMSHTALDSVQVTITDQMNYILSTYGKMLSYEFIMERKIKNFYTKRFYILKLEYFYLKFHFSIYNNGTGWKITNFEYNEDLSELLN